MSNANSKSIGVVFTEEELLASCGDGEWYQWIPEELVESELRSVNDWFYEQAMTSVRDGGRAVWIWSPSQM